MTHYLTQTTNGAVRSPTPEDQWSHDFTSSYYKKKNKAEYLPSKRINYHNDNDELNRTKFNHKRDLYMRKYGDNFDENKLPYYLRTFEAYIKGREVYLARNNHGQQNHQHSNNYRQNFWKLRQNLYSKQPGNKNEGEVTNRPLITLPRRGCLYTRNYNIQQKNRTRGQQSPSRSRSRSRTLSQSRSRSRSRTPPLRKSPYKLSSPSTARNSQDRMFSQSPSPSKSSQKPMTPPVSTRFRPASFSSLSRSRSRSPPPPLQKISFRKRRFSDEQSNDGGSVKSENKSQRSPSSKTPPRTLKSAVVKSPADRDQSLPLSYRGKHSKNSYQVRLFRSPSSSFRSAQAEPRSKHAYRALLHQKSPHSYRSSHERTSYENDPKLTPKFKSNYSLSVIRSYSQEPEAQDSHASSLITTNGTAVDNSLHKPALQNTSLISFSKTISTSKLDLISNSTNSTQINSVESVDLQQENLNNSSNENNSIIPPDAVPFDENGAMSDDANSFMADFHNQTNRPYFVKSENIILFTPCLETFYENITTAMTRLKYPPAFFEAITSYSEERRQELTRILEATVVLAMGQSCALAYNNTAQCNVDFADLTDAQLPVLRALRMIASQYGSVKCQHTSSFLKPIDHTADLRAIVRMATSLLPETIEVDKNDGKQKSQLMALSDSEARNVATRSWLPTCANDKRFFWIFALKIKEFMKAKLGVCPLPADVVEALSSLKKETPRWWTIFRKQLPRDAMGRFDFLWQNWDDKTFYQNLGKHQAAPKALKAIGLKWPAPSQSHLCFDISLKNELIRVNKQSMDNLKLYAANFNVMTCIDLSPDHQGSWNQLASVISYMGWNVFKNCRETNKASQNLALHFPPKIFYDINN